MGVTRVEVPIDRSLLKQVDRFVNRGKFSSRGQAIAAVITQTLQHGQRQLTASDVLKFVRKGRLEHRQGKTVIIGSSAELR